MDIWQIFEAGVDVSEQMMRDNRLSDYPLSTHHVVVD